MLKLPFLLALSGSLCWLLAAPAAAQNLVVNGEFDENLAFWQILNPSITAGWDALDVDDDPISGSARVVSTQSMPGSELAGSGLLQCFSVAPGARLEMSAWAYVPSGQANNALPDLNATYFSDPSCGNFLCNNNTVPCGSALSPQVDTIGVWTLTETIFDVPDNVQSVRLFLRPRKVEAGGSVAAHFDAVFVPEPGVGASLAAACLSMAALARRRA